MQLTAEQQQQLLQMARDSIAHGLQSGSALQPDPAALDDVLKSSAACFVTLTLQNNLRGCIGHLQAVLPLYQDVCDNAFAAAFRDPRFPALQEKELVDIRLEISILTPAEAMHFKHEADLLRQLKPGIDGLILEDGSHRGTFLPSVWEALPDRQDFLKQLKRKAGLPAGHWSDSLQVSRYETMAFSEP